MKKEEFLMKLQALLIEIPADERREALDYYRSYFEDAGEENEARIIQELESPEKVASIIKSDCVTDLAKNSPPKKENKAQTFYENNKGLSIFLIVVIALLASPVWLPVGGTIIGAIVGAFSLLIGLIFGSWGMAIGFIIGGVACITVGIGSLFVSIGAGLILIGVGALLLVFGLLSLLAALWLCIKFLPWCIRSIGELMHKVKNPIREV